MVTSDGRPSTVVVVGATAVGKSDLAVALAQRLHGEVVNADSMQLYRGMDVGTAKLPVDQRHGVPHHLLDIWDVRTAASVAEYRRLADQVRAALRERDRPAVVVGGSGLYVRAVLGDLDFPGTDPGVRVRLEDELRAHGPAALHARLAELDAAAAASILPSNGRRVVRALEVVEVTGERFSARLPDYAEVDAVQVGLSLPRPLLDLRIAARVDRMWELGLVAEVRRLAEQGLREGRTASRALGYAQVLRLLDGELTEEQARAQTVQATRRFARRQDTWFRRDPRIRWVEAAEGDRVLGLDELTDRVLAAGPSS